MKLIILASVLALCLGAKLDRIYLPPGKTNSDGANFLDTPKLTESNGAERIFAARGSEIDPAPTNTNLLFKHELNNEVQSLDTEFMNPDENQQYGNIEEQRPERPQAAVERNAATLREENKINGDAFSYLFETENGIFAEESGIATNGVQAQGQYSYTGDDGLVYSIMYTADENGFVPRGDHLPTAPPIPEEILRALEQNAKDEAAGIFDDGSYDELKYDGNSGNMEMYRSTRLSSQSNDIDTYSAGYLPPHQNGPTNNIPQSPRIASEQIDLISGFNPTSRNDNNVQKTSIDLDRVSQRIQIQTKASEVSKEMNFDNQSAASPENEPTPSIMPVKRPSSYEVPISSSIGETTASPNHFGRRENFNGKPSHTSFNSRTGYKY